ncbi:alpha/beta fold hydrolase [Parendozoicomonas sp. Alg238-R29]|uniref:alpha/beta hydrolase family protein n=1 Tax=Parendozoicomonas sp. Alg238-R29 TaxID=2993446 RepID=UPI00248E62A3|nr:alpha/beta fold hydrolase [Parendozoicomonas sp. Alg238-R29]
MVEQQVITCSDNYPLSINFYPSPNPKGTVIIASAIGVSQTYYQRFADFLVESGLHAITFDYRYTGQNSTSAKSTSLSLSDWGSQDIETVIQFALTKNLPAYFIGHSIGGQLLGLAPSAKELKKMVFVASSAPYWKRWPAPENLKILLAAKVLFPLIAGFTKQFPTKSLGLGNQPIPSPYISQWSRWMTEQDYLFQDTFHLDTSHYPNIKGNILSLGFTDDNLAPEINIEYLLRFFPGAPSSLKILNPKNLGVKAIAHTGFFRDTLKENLWKSVLTWIESGEFQE